MEKIEFYIPGQFCWNELLSADAQASKVFYSELFGWDYADQPVGEGMVYSMCMLQGESVAAMYQISPQQQAMGAVPHWTNYVTVESVDDTVKSASENGGSCIWGPMDVFTAGRMAVLHDPNKGEISLWQPGDHHGNSLFGIHGTPGWTELVTNDINTDKSFYENVFGWTSTDESKDQGQYIVFRCGNKVVAGGISLNDQMEASGVPSHWASYFTVDNVAESTEKAKSLGAVILQSLISVQDIGTFSIVKAPTGEVFRIIEWQLPNDH